jgi:hypothetical protein
MCFGGFALGYAYLRADGDIGPPQASVIAMGIAMLLGMASLLSGLVAKSRTRIALLLSSSSLIWFSFLVALLLSP